MRDEKLYIALGYDNFGDYCEQKAELSRQNVYQYIKVVENLPKDFVLSTRQIGKEKLYLLSTMSESDREEIVETTDLESTTVKQLKDKIKELEEKNSAADKASAESKQQLVQRDEEINRLKGENIKLQGRDEKSTAKLEAETAKVEELKAEKERLEQQLTEAKKRAAEKQESTENPADKKKIADLEAQIKEFENRPIDVVYEKDEEEINRLKEKIAQLESEEKTSKSDIKVFMLKMTFDNLDELIKLVKKSGDPALENAVKNARLLKL